MYKDTPVYQYAQRVLAIDEKAVFKTVLGSEDVKKLIIYLNTQKQLFQESIDSYGNPITNKLTGKSTYSYLDPQGRGGQDYRLFDTGYYYDSYRVEIGDYVINIYSDPKKENDNLFEIYGAGIEGLTPESIEILIKTVREKYKIYYENNILPQ